MTFDWWWCCFWYIFLLLLIRICTSVTLPSVVCELCGVTQRPRAIDILSPARTRWNCITTTTLRGMAVWRQTHKQQRKQWFVDLLPYPYFISLDFKICYSNSIKYIIQTHHCEIATRRMPLNFTTDKPKLIQVLTWWHQASSHYNILWYDMIWYDMINWYDMVWYDMSWYDLIWFEILHDMIYDMIWYDIWYDNTGYDIWYDMIWYDLIWYDMIWYETWYDMTWHDMACHDMTWHGMAWHGMTI